MRPACSALAHGRPVTVEWQDHWFEVVIDRPEFAGQERTDRRTDANDYSFISAARAEDLEWRANAIPECYESGCPA